MLSNSSPIITSPVFQNISEKVDWLFSELQSLKELNSSPRLDPSYVNNDLTAYFDSILAKQILAMKNEMETQIPNMIVQHLNSISPSLSYTRETLHNKCEQIPTSHTAMELENSLQENEALKLRELENTLSEEDSQDQANVLHNLAMQLKKLRNTCDVDTAIHDTVKWNNDSSKKEMELPEERINFLTGKSY